ncbi:hypothetical protein [Burkholderia plantarii]|uniref:Amidohydrolase n=1 Tax=Burkholderia plantarii TaxID=41899 RepID=A0A0B6S369_BURPL|nr:hypothetical protein [Burkholderia plantarii]AJK50118.1 hypothetical protein BGL_2c20540 [Burkholderia plantarii]
MDGSVLSGLPHPPQPVRGWRAVWPAATHGNPEALRSATTATAQILDQPDMFGTIAVDAMADLLVVDGNPPAGSGVLAGHGEHINYVLHGGRVQWRGEVVEVD